VSLPWNRLHIIANHLVISGLAIAHVGRGDENVAGETEREQGLVHKTDVDAKRPVVDGMTDVIHDFALDARIPPSRRAQTYGVRLRCFTIRHWLAASPKPRLTVCQADVLLFGLRAG